MVVVGTGGVRVLFPAAVEFLLPDEAEVGLGASVLMKVGMISVVMMLALVGAATTLLPLKICASVKGDKQSRQRLRTRKSVGSRCFHEVVPEVIVRLRI